VDRREVLDKINYWNDLSQYDLDTAAVMLDGRRYLYVGFMCHQAVEKALKAYHWFFFVSEPEYTHSLSRLARKAELLPLLSEKQISLMDSLEPLNIEARYPADKARLVSFLTHDRCEHILAETKGLVEWLRMRYSK
jgi:HEPN domain-containing protein